SVLFANPRAYEIIGYPEDAITGRQVQEIVHPQEREYARKIWTDCERGDLPRGIDLRLLRAGSEPLVINASFASLPGEDGGFLVSFQDVTEHRRTEAELVKTMEFLESLIDASVDGIVAADLRGTIILFNQGAERLYGYRADEVIGRMRADQLYPKGGAEKVMRMIRSKEFGGRGRLAPIRMVGLNRRGEEIPIQLSAAMIYERGKESATFGIFTDLREKIRVEERLAEATEQLALSEKHSLIAELAGTAAHELNQPLTSIMAYAELLQRKLEGGSAEHRAAETMVREAERMAEIVRKIGKMTKYETKTYVGGQRILDLDKASDSSAPSPTHEGEV
ncbi:MAG: PAS domain S-box protein, partial [Myxococcales bacterium]|nr:PAS domain S-box protein [Myxococcales bacterium]